MAGLDTIDDDKEPPISIVFCTFRMMIAIGFAMLGLVLLLGLGLWRLWARFKARLYDAPMLRRAAIVMGPSGFVAVLAGWITTEVRRQPYTVYGLLTTTESASPIDAVAVATALVAFIVVYFALFGAGTFYMLRLMNKPRHLYEP